MDIMMALFVLLLATFGLFTWPFWGRMRPSHQSDTLDLYHKQLTELEDDLAEGLISQADFDVAKAEVGRRLLRASKNMKSSGMGATSPLVVGVMTVVLLTGSLYAYSYLGRPDLGDRPTVSQAQTAKDQMVTGADGSQQKVGDLLIELDGVLANKPDDIQGWTIMARTAGQMGDAPRMARAYGNLTRLQPENADWWAMQGEALVRISNGRVPPAARHVFKKASQLAPNHPLPRYYLGLAASQDGKLDRALTIWEALKADSAADAPWMQMVTRQIEAATNKLGGNKPDAGPTKEQRDAASEMSPKDQLAFINQMVERLRARMEENPDDLDGWLRLAQAEQVLGNSAGEKVALRKALGVLMAASESSEVNQLIAQLEARLGQLN